MFDSHGLTAQKPTALQRFLERADVRGTILTLIVLNAVVLGLETSDALMARHGQHDSAIRYLWAPLCVSALNTPPSEASAQVFLNVLRDSLAARREARDLLLARTDFSALFPEPAERFLLGRGGGLLRGSAIRSIRRDPYGYRLEGDPDRRNYSHVIAAVDPYQPDAPGRRPAPAGTAV